MTKKACDSEVNGSMSRRKMLRSMGVAVGAAVLAPQLARAQTGPRVPIGPPSTITQPPRDFGPRAAPTTYFTDPDVLTIEPAFDGVRQPNAAIQRLWTGALWSEGPAWNSVGRYLIWSDIPNNRQLRWIEDDGHVSVFRAPSNNSNGNTFDFQGRQLSCEHLVYWNLTIEVIAMDGGNYGFSGEAVCTLRLGPCGLDRPPAFFANTVEYQRRKSLHHKVGFARVCKVGGTGD